MIPIVYSVSLGHPAAIPLGPHRTEVLLTLLQGALGTVLLANFNFHAYEALGLLLFWSVQFVVPGSRGVMCWAYAGLARPRTGLDVLATRPTCRIRGLPRPVAGSRGLNPTVGSAHGNLRSGRST
jgi:hypothetical protein